MNVLVTGADGFVGRHLTRALVQAGHVAHEWTGIDAEAGVDVRNGRQLLDRLEGTRVDAIIHLAGQSSVAHSHAHPALSFDVNATGTVNLLHAVRAHTPRARVLLVGSGEVYGALPEGAAAVESSPVAPRSPYAAAKAAAEIAALQFHRSYGLDVVCARPFNHTGRGQAPHFVVPSFACQIAAAGQAGTAGVLRTGDLTAVRDFSHVEDVVAAYLCLLERGVSGRTYNVGSGMGVSIGGILRRMLTLSGADLPIELDPEKMRPIEIPFLVGDSGALRTLGWAPSRTLDNALADVLRDHGAHDPGLRSST